MSRSKQLWRSHEDDDMNSTASEPTAGETPGSSARNSHGRKSVVRGSAWALGGYALGQIIRLGGNIVLAALLFEEAFALMAITTAVMQGMTMFSDLGLSQSIVQNRRGNEPDFLNTAWTLQVLRGIGLALVMCALAWPVASFYASNDPMAWDLLYLLPLVALSTLISGFQSTKVMVAARELQLARVTAIELTTQVVSLTAMIAGAWLWKSVYAIAAGYVVGSTVQCLLTHLAIPGVRSKFRLERSAVWAIVHFGKWIFLSTAITFFALQLDKLAFAKMFPLDLVGVYGIAANLALLTPMLMNHLQVRIAFPLYSRTLQNQGSLPNVVEQSKYPMLTVGAFIVAAFIASGSTFIEFAYDHRYEEAGTFVAILSVGGWFATIHGIYSCALLASGKAKATALTNAVKVIAFGALLFPAAKLGAIRGAIVALVAADLAKTLTAIVLARKLGLRNHTKELLFSLYCGVVGGGVLWVTTLPYVRSSLHSAPLLLVQLALVSLAFLPSFLVAKRKLIR